MKYIIFIVLLTISMASNASQFVLGVGNILEFSEESDGLNLFVNVSNKEEQSFQLGARYTFLSSKNYSYDIGAGMTYSEHLFASIPVKPGEYEGYHSLSGTVIRPFIGIRMSSNKWFVLLDYSDVDYLITRTHIVSIIDDIVTRESLTSYYDGNNIKVSVGFKLTF